MHYCQELVQIRVEEETFVVHKDLFFYYVADCCDYLQWDDERRQQPSIAMYYVYDAYPDAYLFRALVHWIYTQELPTNDVIAQTECPKAWANDTEKNPLACKMAFELYILAWRLDVSKLKNDIMTYIFELYRQEGRPPHLDHVRRLSDTFVLEYDPEEDEPIWTFCVDFWHKWAFTDMETELSYDGGFSNYPKELLYGVFVRERRLNRMQTQQAKDNRPSGVNGKSTTGDNYSERPGVMRLSDYHAFKNNPQIHPQPCEGCAKASIIAIE